MDLEILSRRLERLELKMDKLVAHHRRFNTTTTEEQFISESEALKILCRSKSFLKKHRLGVKSNGKITKPSLEKEIDWFYINGRTPQYRAAAIWNLKRKLQN